jgi:hypothetical protein
MIDLSLQSKPFAQLSWPKELSSDLDIRSGSSLAFFLLFAALPSFLGATRLPIRVDHLR